MKAAIIDIGNSKGVRIPKPLLEESGLKGPVELKAKKGEIKIVPSLSETRGKVKLNEEYVLSISSLSEWNTPEEDRAWAHLQ
jgi:antitoxin MazE